MSFSGDYLEVTSRGKNRTTLMHIIRLEVDVSCTSNNGSDSISNDPFKNKAKILKTIVYTIFYSVAYFWSKEMVNTRDGGWTKRYCSAIDMDRTLAISVFSILPSK